MRIGFHANFTCTGSCDLDVDSVGAKTMKKRHDVNMATGDIEANQYVEVIYSATDDTFQVISPLATVTTEFDAGTVMLFYQAVAPGGWTKDVGGLDNHALRVVPGSSWSGGTNGATNFDTVFGSGTVAGPTTLTGGQSGTSAHGHGDTFSAASNGAHTHTSHGHDNDSADSFAGGGTSGTENADSTGSSGAHTHTISGSVSNSSEANADDPHGHTLSLDLNYINMIIATKN